ncbi:hypothetical protein HYW83_04835 [Candidatus Peregrinibacteria bacterium]|nr:hypothetical protein [Candidatus Peregrinibacteria bacterium]
MGAETQREENVGLNGIAGTVGINAAVEYMLANDDPDLHLTRGNDLVFKRNGPEGGVDEDIVRDFARYLAEFGNQGRRLLDEPIRTSARRMAVVRAIEAHRNRLRFVVDNYVTHPDNGRYLVDPLHEVRDDTIELDAIKDPQEIPWSDGEHPAGHVVDATTQIVTADDIRKHLRGRVTQAVKTAPAKGGGFDFLWVAGVTDDGFRPAEHRAIAEGACTLQCFGAVMDPLFGVKNLRPQRIEFSTIHGVTGDQKLVRGFRPEDMPRGLPGDEDFIRTKSGSAGDLTQLVRFLALRHGTFARYKAQEDLIAELVEKTRLTSATRVPPKDSATLDFRVEADGDFTQDDILEAYRIFGREHPEVLRVEENPVAIASSTIRGRRESGIMFLDTLEVEDGHIIRGTAGYAHEDNSPHASMRISKMIAERKRMKPAITGAGVAG